MRGVNSFILEGCEWTLERSAGFAGSAESAVGDLMSLYVQRLCWVGRLALLFGMHRVSAQLYVPWKSGSD